MRKFLFALVAVLACGSFVSANEPVALEGLGLDGLQSISETEGKEVRGLAAQAYASGLSSLGAIFYDTTSGSKANVDLVNFAMGGEGGAGATTGGADGSTNDGQAYNQIGLGAALTLTFPGAGATVSAFSAGGASQAGSSLGAATLALPVPASFAP
ncbi:MAG: hypothetical protein ACKO38_03835 [Planctomycetota bacterium]